MAEIYKGKDVVAAMKEKMISDVEALKAKGTIPTLAIVRVGERGDDIAYEKGAMTRCKSVGVEVRNIILNADATQDELLLAIDQVNKDKGIHGCLLFRPLPKHINDDIVRRSLAPEKDVDGITDISMAGVYSGSDVGFPPCTPKACMEILDFFGINVTGKNVVVIGRSLVVGKPAAMMLIKKNATVTICHTKTADMPAICRNADIIIASAGVASVVNAEYLSAGQIVIDVGINVDAEGNLKGDVDFDAAEQIVGAVTPVPGGVGTVTTSVLVKHVIEAAKKL